MADQDWREAIGLDEETRALPALKDIPDAKTAIKVLLDLQAYKGQSIRIPGTDAGDEARAEFRARLKEKVPELVLIPADPKAREAVEGDIWAKLGRPAKPEDYDLEGLELADGVQLDQAKLRELGKTLGLTKAQLKEAAKLEGAGAAAQLEAGKANLLALRKEFGVAFEEKMQAAATAADAVGLADDAAAIRAGRVSPARAKAFVALSARLHGKPNEVGQQGNTGGAPGKLTPAEARAKLEELRDNPKYWDGKHPELHAKAVELTAMAYPS